MRRRDVLVGAGLATAAVGLTAMFAPGVLALSMSSVVLTALGGLMVLHAVARLNGTDHALDQSDPGDPERRRPMPRPGDEADVMIAGFERVNDGPIRHRRLIREWVTDAAVGVIAHTDGITEAEARGRIQDQVYAARRELGVIADFDSEGRRDPVSGVGVRGPLRVWKRLRASDEPPLRRKVREAVNTLSRRLDLPPIDAEEAYLDDVQEASERLSPPARDGPPADHGSDWKRTEIRDGVYREAHRETGHWNGMGILAFAFGGTGVITGQPPLLLAAAVGIGFAAYANNAEYAGTNVSVERSLSPDRPDPGEETTVSLTIHNVGDRLLPDLRVVDGVPDRLEVVAGEPRFGTALRPGEEATFEYAVSADRGTHEFGDVTVISRDASGAIEDEIRIEEATELACVPSLRRREVPAPLRDLAAGFVGQMAVQRGGGVEFYAEREYRPGDPPSRIDWNRHARTGELATLQFREERSTTVFILIDSRAEAYVAPDEGEHAVDRAVDAAGRLFTALVDGSNPTGIASLGPDRCWIDPNVGHHHEHRVEEALGTHAAFSPLPPLDRRPTLSWLRDVRSRLPEDCQVVFVTPLCDDFGPFVARRLEAFKHPVTVLSPDPTTGDTLGRRIAHLQRFLRILDLRGSDIPVVDWEWNQPLEVALREESLRGGP